MDYMYASDLIVVTPSEGTCKIPNNPKAKLMYYLDCLYYVVDLKTVITQINADYNVIHHINLLHLQKHMSWFYCVNFSTQIY